MKREIWFEGAKYWWLRSRVSHWKGLLCYLALASWLGLGGELWSRAQGHRPLELLIGLVQAAGLIGLFMLMKIHTAPYRAPVLPSHTTEP